MLTPELRTISLLKVLELWDEDKETLKDELMMDYTMLKDEYRRLCKEYNKSSTMVAKISLKITSCDRINYKKEFGLDELKWGHIKLSNDVKQNINVLHDLKDYCVYLSNMSSTHKMKKNVYYKAREIVEVLGKLNVKINFAKDFEKKSDEWLNEDLEELRIENS